MFRTLSPDGCSPVRARLASFEHAYAVAIQLKQATGRDHYVVATGDSMRPFCTMDSRTGIKTVLNLRGERSCGSYWLERAACARHGVRLVNYQLRSRAAPSKAELWGAKNVLDSVEYPILLHCKSGSDRAGLMSVLYKHLKLGQPIVEAKRELSLKYGHIRQSDTGILDAFFERYLADTAAKPMAFFDWVDQVYDPEDLKARYVASGWANRLVNGVLRRE